MTATVDSELGQPDPSGGLPADIVEYVAAVRALLTDLDPDEIDDLTDDLHSHLAEIRAESEEPFADLIGTPEQFAAELRQSAGLAQATPAGLRLGSVTRSFERIARTAERRFAPIVAHRWTRATLDFLPELRPAWWVARGYLLAGLLALMTGGRLATFLAVPSIAGSSVVGFGVMVAFIVASVRFGRRHHPAPWARWVTVITAVLAAWVAVILFDQVSSSYVPYGYDAEPVAVDGPFVVDPFVDELLPANIYAVLPDGTPLDQVLLYDETGGPVNLPESGYSIEFGAEYEAEPAFDESGRPVGNLFPRRVQVLEWSEETGDLELRVLPPPVIDWKLPITPRPPATDGRSSTTTSTTVPATTSSRSAPASSTTTDTEGEGEGYSTVTDPDGP